LSQAVERDRSREPLVKIAVAENPATAELVRQTLAEDGIRCLVKNTDPIGVMYGSLWTSPFALQIFVLSGDEARAQELFAAHGWDASVPLSLPVRVPRRYKRRR
jgi:hypothetical protein